jgi:tetratricopeptide (TPR) repeat protein
MVKNQTHILSLMDHSSVRSLMKEAIAYHENNELEKSKIIYQQILKAHPKEPNALNLLGVIESQTNNDEKAISLLKESISYDNALSGAHYNLATVLKKTRRFEEALHHLEQSIILHHCVEDCYVQCAEIYLEQKNFSKALWVLDKVLSIDSDCIPAILTKSNIYIKKGDNEKAWDLCQKAIDLGVNDAASYGQLGLLCAYRNDFEQAIKYYEQANLLDQHFKHAHYNKGLSQLTMGNFKDGWKNYEYRRDIFDCFCTVETPDSPKKNLDHLIPLLKNVNDIHGKKIFVWTEQGFGDVIQISRYMEKIHDLGAEVFFYVNPPLYELFLDQWPSCTMVKELHFSLDQMKQFDYQLPIMSLPYVFETDLDTIPHKTPYITPKKEKQAYWKEKLSLQHTTLNIGISCSGNHQCPHDEDRSMMLQEFFPLLEMGNLFLIQKEVRDGDKDFLKAYPSIRFLGDDIHDFCDTASIIDHMDVIVTVDTSLLHLAGAMGKKAYGLLSWIHEFRWLIGRSDSPWYPTIKLIRQKVRCDWTSVIAEAVLDIKANIFPSSPSLSPIKIFDEIRNEYDVLLPDAGVKGQRHELLI